MVCLGMRACYRQDGCFRREDSATCWFYYDVYVWLYKGFRFVFLCRFTVQRLSQLYKQTRSAIKVFLHCTHIKKVPSKKSLMVFVHFWSCGFDRAWGQNFNLKKQTRGTSRETADAVKSIKMRQLDTHISTPSTIYNKLKEFKKHFLPITMEALSQNDWHHCWDRPRKLLFWTVVNGNYSASFSNN